MCRINCTYIYRYMTIILYSSEYIHVYSMPINYKRLVQHTVLQLILNGCSEVEGLHKLCLVQHLQRNITNTEWTVQGLCVCMCVCVCTREFPTLRMSTPSVCMPTLSSGWSLIPRSITSEMYLRDPAYCSSM